MSADLVVMPDHEPDLVTPGGATVLHRVDVSQIGGPLQLVEVAI
jgi:hypothetical protein